MRHAEDCHKGEESVIKFKMGVVGCYPRAMDRQIGEGCFIQSPEVDLIMNGKLDHMQPVIGRMVVSTAVYSAQRRGRNIG